ncbi:Antiviral protein CAP [Leucoagaricus sp. SymC.cos]|nr:Antiviral protein CAP [Leucoagaricus sp. SymC.cos]
MADINCTRDGLAEASSCLPFVDTFCDDAGSASTPLRFGDSTSRCFDTPNGNRCDFISFNSSVNGTSGIASNCKVWVRDIINQCPMGGWFFAVSGSPPAASFTWSVDPNFGKCAALVQGGS